MSSVEQPQAHTHQHTKRIANQLARTTGHVAAIKRMVEEGRSCPEILIQLAAVRAAIERTSRLVLEDHLETCIKSAVENGNADDELERLKEALDRFIR